MSDTRNVLVGKIENRTNEHACKYVSQPRAYIGMKGYGALTSDGSDCLPVLSHFGISPAKP